MINVHKHDGTIVKATNIEQRGQLRLICRNVEVQLCIDYM